MKLVKILLLVSLGVLLSGCNTSRGFGADLELLGRKMQGLNSDQMIVEGLPPENIVVEVPTTYQSGEVYKPLDSNYSSAQSSYDTQSYEADVQSYQADTQVYTTPYEGDQTYSTIPDAVTYPMEN